MALPVNVPRAPGVPNVLFASTSTFLTFLTRDAVNLFLGAPASPWGIYSGGAPVVTAESVLAFDYRKQFSLSDYPVERGGFEDFDKVELPYDVIFRFVKGGGPGSHQTMLKSIDAAVRSLDLYTVVTPDATYQNVNLTHVDYSRNGQQGLGLLAVDVWGMEVRQVVSTGAATNTKDPSSAAQQKNGPTQPRSPTTQQNVLTNHIAGGHATE